MRWTRLSAGRGQRAVPPCGDQIVHAVQVQRAHPDTRGDRGVAKDQPLRQVGEVGFGDADRDKKPSPLREAPGGKPDHRSTGRVKPLRVVDRQQHRRSRTEALNSRAESRGDRPFVDVRHTRGEFVSRLVQRKALRAGQFTQHRFVDPIEQVSHRSERILDLRC